MQHCWLSEIMCAEAHLHVHERPRPLDRVLPTSSAAERSHLQVLRQQRSRQEFFRRHRRRQKNLRNGWPDCDVDGFNSSGSDYDDDSSSDSSSNSEYDHTLDDQPEWDARQKREFRVEQPPLAGWARRADGQLCDEHTPPPTVPHAHLFDPNNLPGRKGLRTMPSATGFNSDLQSTKYPMEHTFRCRDAHHVLQHLLSNSVFCGHQHLRPMKVFEVKSNGQEQRVYGAPHTADKAWEMQDTLDDPTDVAIRIDTSSDSTVLSIGTGTASAHPVYMSLGVNAGFLKRENHGGWVVIAFLPKVERADKGNGKMFRIYKRRVLHRAPMSFGPVSVDYPEACWLTSLVQGYVPCCVQGPLKLQEGPAAPRTSANAYQMSLAAIIISLYVCIYILPFYS
ncbi:BQ5605_C006g04255 [Microbotryum silenes-dioicae]|uniref:BQ5605_C006g04255 protein n=1 Tax=Microbotryum silenes-dioicae TaxID=796604 RepID=A0A2X0M9F0_9BASI|nr:BQ5605_C006g04255 [Microbotryum silenes-dioicae]